MRLTSEHERRLEGDVSVSLVAQMKMDFNGANWYSAFPLSPARSSKINKYGFYRRPSDILNMF